MGLVASCASDRTNLNNLSDLDCSPSPKKDRSPTKQREGDDVPDSFMKLASVPFMKPSKRSIQKQSLF